MRKWTKILPLFVVEWLAWNWPPWDEGKRVAPTIQRRWKYVPGPEGVQFRRLRDRHENEGTGVSEVERRWEEGIPHDPRSERLARELAEIDHEEGGDRFHLKFGGDGDNGEHLMYLLDIYFARRPTPPESGGDDG